ncbi:MAG: porin [Gammaproteobacteria bacterium]
MTLPSWSSETPSTDEMWRIIQQQQAQIEELQDLLSISEQKNVEQDDRLAVTDEKVEIAGDMIEQVAATPSTGNWSDRTSLGAYGEMHYNNLDSKDELDFHRFVVFLGHEYNENIRMFSEIELEHSLSGDGKPGEVELEQAYVEFDLNDQTSARGGLFLMPVGLLNETHEPPFFFGVERNPVEKNIIPTSWWEGGASVLGRFGEGFSYDLAMTSGLDVDQTGSNSYLIRNGRQKVAKARADDFAYTGRLKWTGMPGVELALTGQYQSDITQGDQGVDATLFEAHADIRRGPWGLRALFARWDLSDSGTINASDPEAVGRDEQMGWYVEPSVRGAIGNLPGEFGAFVRYNVWDNNAGSSNDTEEKQINFGVNYWPIEDVVLKLDVQNQDNEGRADDNGFNLGVGYQF